MSHIMEFLITFGNHDLLKGEPASSCLSFLKQHFVESTKSKLMISEYETS